MARRGRAFHKSGGRLVVAPSVVADTRAQNAREEIVAAKNFSSVGCRELFF
jgi:hypothetical protein